MPVLSIAIRGLVVVTADEEEAAICGAIRAAIAAMPDEYLLELVDGWYRAPDAAIEQAA